MGVLAAAAVAAQHRGQARDQQAPRRGDGDRLARGLGAEQLRLGRLGGEQGEGGFDADLERAALSCGTSPLKAFLLVTLPQITPGIVSAALFAFIISFDEPVISFFISDLDHRSLPRKMFEDIDYNISPTLAAVATMLTALTLLALVVGHFLTQRSKRN